MIKLNDYLAFKLKSENVADYFLVSKDHYNKSTQWNDANQFEGFYAIEPNPEKLPRKLSVGDMTNAKCSQLHPDPVDPVKKRFTIIKQWSATDNS